VAKAKVKPAPTKFEVLGTLLGNLGKGIIDQDRFWRDMKREGFDDETIDWWCQQYYESVRQKSA